MTLFQLMDSCHNLEDNKIRIALYVYDKPIDFRAGEWNSPTKDEILGSEYYRKYLDYSVTGFVINSDTMIVDLIK